MTFPRIPKIPIPFGLRFPQTNPTSTPILEAIEALAWKGYNCSKFYLDTVQGMSDPYDRQGENHHQGIARTHRLSNGTVYWFLSHSEVDQGSQGSISVYCYDFPLDDEHVVTNKPLYTAPMTQILMINDRHPSDIVFLPDFENRDAGYLFVTQEYDLLRLQVFYWKLNEDKTPADLVSVGIIQSDVDNYGPQFVFIDLVGDTYYLGLASEHWGVCQVYRAAKTDLFPELDHFQMNLQAFNPIPGAEFYPFETANSPSQIKLIRDSTGAWFLLQYGGLPEGDMNGNDYVDIYPISFEPFAISPMIKRVHVYFAHGDTGFTSTGTHYVEPNGQILISSSYRWSEEESDEYGYVSRVDEILGAS